MSRLTAEIKWKYDTYFTQTNTVLPSSFVNSIFWTPKLIMFYFCTCIIHYSTVLEREYVIIRWFCCWSYKCWKIYCSMSDNLFGLMTSIYKLFFCFQKSLVSGYIMKVKWEIKDQIWHLIALLFSNSFLFPQEFGRCLFHESEIRNKRTNMALICPLFMHTITAIFQLLIMNIIAPIRFYTKLGRLSAGNQIWYGL